uniref:Uncharacterized protein n=1 Tax=Meloidogyne enterolobii TaxID=390850 RepID=A0A6V7VLQ6_MELEN|nr:unnamed protein product [Meloidogyne enterolobii]
MDVYRRLSFSPSKHRSTPNSRLTKEEIDEILESPYETNYTYSYTFAYKTNVGNREYIHPRLCRKFPITPTKFTQIEQQNIFKRIFILISSQIFNFFYFSTSIWRYFYSKSFCFKIN